MSCRANASACLGMNGAGVWELEWSGVEVECPSSQLLLLHKQVPSCLTDARTWPMSMAGLMGLPTSMTMSVRRMWKSPVSVSSSTSAAAAPCGMSHVCVVCVELWASNFQQSWAPLMETLWQVKSGHHASQLSRSKVLKRQCTLVVCVCVGGGGMTRVPSQVLPCIVLPNNEHIVAAQLRSCRRAPT